MKKIKKNIDNNDSVTNDNKNPNKKLNKKEKKHFKFNIKENLKKIINCIKKYKRLILLGIILLIILIVICVSIYNFIMEKKYEKYYKYEEKMDIYGYTQLYSNESSNTSDKVTRIEAVKMVIAATLNITDISPYMYTEIGEYDGDKWGEYAEDFGILGDFDINADNYLDEVDYITVITYFKNAKDILVEGSSIEDYVEEISDLGNYSIEEQIAIKDLLGNNIIIEFDGKLEGNKEIFKGQLNEIVVNYVQELNTITIGDDKLNINPNNTPENNDDYPYTLANIDKSVYEMEFSNVDGLVDFTPTEVYRYNIDDLPQLVMFVEQYFNIFLNVDYNTISANDFENSLNPYLLYNENTESIENYIDYVKENDIIISGSAEAIMPIFYFDGSTYRIRVKVSFNVENSKTDTNILYYDMNVGGNTIYSDESYEFYIDYAVTEAMNTNYFYLSMNTIFNTIVDGQDLNIIFE